MNKCESHKAKSIPVFKDKLFATLIGIAVGISLLCSCLYYNTDDYPLAQFYTFQFSRQALLSKIDNFKEQNPGFQLVIPLQSGQKVELKNTYTTHFCHVYFYLSDRNETLHCVINISDSFRTTQIGLEAVSKGVRFERWREINTKDLSKTENMELKQIFEKRILNKLGKWSRK